MDRITGRFSNGTAYVKSDGCFGGSIGHFTTQKRLPEIIDKLAEFEDFMEDNGFRSFDDLYYAFGYIRFVDGYDEVKNEEIHKQEFIRYADAYKDRVKAYKELYNKNQALKDRWQKLKELLKKHIEHNQKEYDGSFYVEFQHYSACENWVLDRMQELENVGEKGEEV